MQWIAQPTSLSSCWNKTLRVVDPIPSGLYVITTTYFKCHKHSTALLFYSYESLNTDIFTVYYVFFFCFPFTKIWIYSTHWEFWDKSSIWRFFIYSELQNCLRLGGLLCTVSRDVGVLNLGICAGLFFCLSQMTKKFNFMFTTVWTFGGDMFEIQKNSELQ